MKPIDDHELEELAKAAEGQLSLHSTPKPKQGGKVRPRTAGSPLDRYKTSPDFKLLDEDLEHDIAAFPSLHELRKEILETMQRVSQDINDPTEAKAFKDCAGKVIGIATQAMIHERASKAHQTAVKVAQEADKNPTKASSPDLLGLVAEQLGTPTPKETELKEQLLQVLQGTSSNGSFSLDNFKGGVEEIFMQMKPSLLKHKETFGRVLTQILVKLNNAFHAAHKAGKFEEALQFMKTANDLNKQYREQYIPLCKTLGHSKTVELFLSKSNPFNGVTEAQWSMITGLAAGANSSEYQSVVEAVLPALAQPTKKKERQHAPAKRKRHLPSDSDSEESQNDSDGSDQSDMRPRKKGKHSRGSGHGGRRHSGYDRQSMVVVCGYCGIKGHIMKECRSYAKHIKDLGSNGNDSAKKRA